MGKKSIQEEIEEDTTKLFKKMDKLIMEYWGNMCPDFEPDCIQCKVHLSYNQFKNKIWQDFIRK